MSAMAFPIYKHNPPVSDMPSQTQAEPDGNMEQGACCYCSKTFASMGSFLEHLETHNLPSHACIDSAISAQTDLLNKAVQTGSSEKTSPDKKKRKLVVHACKVCSKTYNAPDRLREHMRVHTNERLQCEMCSKKFIWKDSLWSHRRKMHPERITGTRPSPEKFCEACQLSFSSRADLLQHMKKHITSAGSSKPLVTRFKCLCCSSLFDTKKQLNIHRKIHAQGQPYICGLCSNLFSESQDFEQHHNSVHPGLDSSVLCGSCGVTFNSVSALRGHLEVDTGDYGRFIKGGKLVNKFTGSTKTLDQLIPSSTVEGHLPVQNGFHVQDTKVFVGHDLDKSSMVTGNLDTQRTQISGIWGKLGCGIVDGRGVKKSAAFRDINVPTCQVSGEPSMAGLLTSLSKTVQESRAIPMTRIGRDGRVIHGVQVVQSGQVVPGRQVQDRQVLPGGQVQNKQVFPWPGGEVRDRSVLQDGNVQGGQTLDTIIGTPKVHDGGGPMPRFMDVAVTQASGTCHMYTLPVKLPVQGSGDTNVKGIKVEDGTDLLQHHQALQISNTSSLKSQASSKQVNLNSRPLSGRLNVQQAVNGNTLLQQNHIVSVPSTSSQPGSLVFPGPVNRGILGGLVFGGKKNGLGSQPAVLSQPLSVPMNQPVWVANQPMSVPSLVPSLIQPVLSSTQPVSALSQRVPSWSQSGLGLSNPVPCSSHSGPTLSQPILSLSQPVPSLIQPVASASQLGLMLSRTVPSLSHLELLLKPPMPSLSKPELALNQSALRLSQPVSTSSQPGLALNQSALRLSQPVSTSSQPGLALNQPALRLSQPVSTSSQPGLASSQHILASSQSELALSQSDHVPSLSQFGLALNQPVPSLSQPVPSLSQFGLVLSQPVPSLSQSGQASSQSVLSGKNPVVSVSDNQPLPPLIKSVSAGKLLVSMPVTVETTSTVIPDVQDNFTIQANKTVVVSKEKQSKNVRQVETPLSYQSPRRARLDSPQVLNISRDLPCNGDMLSPSLLLKSDDFSSQKESLNPSDMVWGDKLSKCTDVNLQGDDEPIIATLQSAGTVYSVNVILN